MINKITLLTGILACLGVPSFAVIQSCDGKDGGYLYDGQQMTKITNPFYLACGTIASAHNTTPANIQLKGLMAVFGEVTQYQCAPSLANIKIAEKFCAAVHKGQLVTRKDLGLTENSQLGKVSVQGKQHYNQVSLTHNVFTLEELEAKIPDTKTFVNLTNDNRFVAVDYKQTVRFPVEKGAHAAVGGAPYLYTTLPEVKWAKNGAEQMQQRWGNTGNNIKNALRSGLNTGASLLAKFANSF